MNGGILNSIKARLAGWHLARVLVWLFAAMAAAALLALLADAALDFSEATRAATPWLLAVLALALIFTGVWRLRRLNETFVARLFESRDPRLGNRLTNAVQLAPQAGETPVQEWLRLDTVERGRRTASELTIWPVVRRRVKSAAAGASAVVLAWLALIWLAGSLLQAVVPRFLDPRGDHPPYSRLQIEVLPGAAEVLFGGQIEIRASAGGRPVDKLWLVNESKDATTRAIMFLAPDRTFFQTLANVREPGEYFVTDGRARSRRFPVSVRYTPEITLVEVTTVFPEYTGRPSRTGKPASEAQALPAGTRVQFRVASNRPLQSGALTLTPALGGEVQEVALEPEGESNIVSGEFTMKEPILFQLGVRDTGGLDSNEALQGRFNILPDARPRLIVIEPGRNAVATPSIRVPIRVQAEDDYGITQVMWLRSHNHSIERPLDMEFETLTGPHFVEATGAFDMEKLGVRPGDVIEYYFEAADNYPDGPNLALSRMYRLEIISHEQYEEILRRAAARKALFEPYFQLSGWLRRLAERAHHLEEKAKTASEGEREALMAEARDLAEQLNRYNQELGKLLGQAVYFDIEQTFRETLVTTHAQTRQAAERFNQSLAGGQLSDEQLEELSRELAELARWNAETVEGPARHLAAVSRLLARADRFVKLAQEQATLARMLERFSDRRDNLTRIERIELEELTHQQRRIQSELQQWMVSLPELVQALPEDSEYDQLRHDVEQFMQAVADAQIDLFMSEAVTVLNQGEGWMGQTFAKMAADAMDRLIGRCDALEGTGELCLRFQPSLANMGNSLQQILSAMGAGDGAHGADGYSMFDENLGLYGPNMDVARDARAGGGEMGGSSGHHFEQLGRDPHDPGLPSLDAPGRVRLQPDARFPLRYRELVGEYFRAIAESEMEGGR